MKHFFKTFVGLIIVLLLYLFFVADRIILSPLPNHQHRFLAWADLNVKDDLRTYRDVVNSIIRVVIVSLIIWLIWLFK